MEGLVVTGLPLAQVELSNRSTHAPSYSGRSRIEQRNPSLFEATRRSLDDKTQADPKLRGSELYTRMTGQFLRRMLAEDLGIAVEQLPSTRSMRPIDTEFRSNWCTILLTIASTT